jgi:hypothetical protein
LLAAAIVFLLGLSARFLSTSVQLPSQWQRQRLVQEYMDRRFTSRSGYLYSLQGINYALSKAFKGLLAGLVFCCVALLVGGHAPIVWGMCLGGAIVYFGWAWSWLSPPSSWRNDDMHTHWTRVAELEKQLFGKVEEDTQKLLDQNPTSHEGKPASV